MEAKKGGSTLTIDEAIDIKGRTGEEFLNTDPDDIDEAERLSIEALKLVKDMRDFQYWGPPTLLQGESDDTAK